MSNVYSLEEALMDGVALLEVAKKAGILQPYAKRVCAALSSLPPEQILRICEAARLAHLREINRETRKGER